MNNSSIKSYLAAVLIVGLLQCGAARGAAVSWNGSVTGTQNWNNTANWGTGTGPVPGLVASNADTVTIGGGATFNSPTIQMLDTSNALFSPDINKLTITARTSGFSNRTVTINQGTGGGTLSLGSGGFQGNDGDSFNTVTMAAPIALTANQNWSWNNANANHNMNSLISGNFTITHTGGRLRFSAQSTFTGFTINGGTTTIFASSTAGTGVVTSGPLGTGTLTLTGGTLESNDGTARSIHNSVLLAGNVTLGQTATQTGTITFTPSTAGTTFNLSSAANNVTRTLNNNVNVTIGHAIGETGGGTGLGLVKAGASTLTLGGANTYTGPTNITAGTLTLNATGSIANSSAITITSGATFNISAVSGGFALGASQTLTGGRVSAPATDITGTLSSAGTINVGGTGTAATLSIAGGLTLTGGTLRFDVSNNISSGNDLIAITGALNLSNTTTIQINLLNPIATGTYTLISGGTSVTGGAANLSLTGLPTPTRQTFALDTTTSPGSVLLVVTGAPGTIIWSGPGAWDLNTTPNWDAGANTFFNLDNVTFNDASANGAVALNFSAIVGGVTCNNSTTNYTISGTGAITGVGAALSKSGTGSLTMSTANTYTGTTTVSGGTLVAGINNAFGSGPMTVSGSGSVLDLAGFTASMGTVTLNSAGSLNGSGSTLTSTGTFELQDGTVNLILGGTGALNKTTSGTVTLNAANTATGLTTVSDGTLAYGITNALATGAVTVNGAAAVLSLGAFNDTVGTVTVAGGGSITGTGTLTSTGTFEMQNGSVAAKLGGTGIVLNKTTTGTVTLSGANTYTGATSITAGILNAQSATALGTTAGGATVSTGATLQLQGGIAIGAETLTLSGTGAAGQNGGLVNVSGTNTYGGNISLQAHSAISSDSGSLTLSNGITGTNFNMTLTGAGNGFVGTGITTGSGTLVKNGTGTWQLNNNASTYTGLTTINAGVLTIRNATSLGTTAAGTIVNSGGTLQLQNNITLGLETLTLSGVGASGQTGALTNLSGANTYGGLITLGASATIASDSGTMTISNTGTITGSGFDLTLGGASDGTLASIVGTGAGGLIKTGAGSWTLTGANTYSGMTSVNAGTLVLATGSSISSSATTVAGGMLRGTGTAGAITVTSGMVFPGAAIYSNTVPAFTSNQVLNVAGTVSVDFSNGKLGVLLVPGTTGAGGAVSQLSVPTGTVILGTNSILSVGAQADTGFTYGSTGTKYVIISQNTNNPSITNSFKQVIGLPSQFSVNYFSGGPTGTPVSDGGTAGGTLTPSAADTVVITYNGGTVTPVKIADFAAKSEGAGVNVSWTCVSEYQNAGFNIYRRALECAEWGKVNPVLIAGRITNPDERKYAYFDFAPAGMYEYKLESIDLSGGREVYAKLSEVVDVDWNSEFIPGNDVPTEIVDSAVRSIDMAASAATAQRAETLFAAARVSEPVPQASRLPVASQPQVDTKVAVREIAARSTANVSIASNIQAQSPAVGIRWFSSGRIDTTSNYTKAKVTYKGAGLMLIPQSSMPAGFDLGSVALQREGRNLNALAKVSGGLLVYAPGYKDNYTDKDAIFIRKTTGATNAGTPTSATGLFFSEMPVNVTSSNSVTNEYHDVYFDYSLRPNPVRHGTCYSTKCYFSAIFDH